MTKDEALKMRKEQDEYWSKIIKQVEQPAQEPVELIRNESGNFSPKHQWQGLTEDEIENILHKHYPDEWEDFARAIEQALKEKNT